MAVYSFMDVTASLIGPGVILDLGSGAGISEEGITVTLDNSRNSMTLGIDGEGMNSLLPGKSGTVKVSLLQTSPVNKKLSLAYNAQSQSATTWGNNVIVIRNNTSGDVVTARGVAFTKHPDHTYAKEGGTTVWEFQCVKVDQVLGVF